MTSEQVVNQLDREIADARAKLNLPTEEASESISEVARIEEIIEQESSRAASFNEVLKQLATRKDLLDVLNALNRNLPLAAAKYHGDYNGNERTVLELSPQGEVLYYLLPDMNVQGNPIKFRLMDLTENGVLTDQDGNQVQMQDGLNNRGAAPITQTREEIFDPAFENGYRYPIFFKGDRGFVVAETAEMKRGLSAVKGEPLAHYYTHHLQRLPISGETIMQTAVTNLHLLNKAVSPVQ